MGLHVDLEMCGAKTVTHRVKQFMRVNKTLIYLIKKKKSSFSFIIIFAKFVVPLYILKTF